MRHWPYFASALFLIHLFSVFSVFVSVNRLGRQAETNAAAGAPKLHFGFGRAVSLREIAAAADDLAPGVNFHHRPRAKIGGRPVLEHKPVALFDAQAAMARPPSRAVRVNSQSSANHFFIRLPTAPYGRLCN